MGSDLIIFSSPRSASEKPLRIIHHFPICLSSQLLHLRHQSPLITRRTYSIIDGPGHGVCQSADSIELGDAVGYPEAYSFKIPYGLTESFPLVGIAGGYFQNRSATAHTDRNNT